MDNSAKEKYKKYLNTQEGVRIYNIFKEIMYDNPDSFKKLTTTHFKWQPGWKYKI